MKIEIFESKPWARTSEWYIHYVSENGEVLMHSEGYTRESDAVRARDKVLEDIKSGDYTFNVDPIKPYKTTWGR